MPCDSIRTVTVELGKVHMQTFRAGLEALGMRDIREWRGGLYWRNGYADESIDSSGRLTLEDESRANVLKRAYSAAIVQGQAKKYGWQVKKVAEYQYEIIKR